MAKTSMKVKQQRPQKYSTREYNRCKICGRPHGYLRKFGICRICFRELGLQGSDSRCKESQLVSLRESGMALSSEEKCSDLVERKASVL